METAWENTTKKQAQEIYPAPGPKSPMHYKPSQGDSLLLVQCILCVAAVIFVLLVRTVDANVFAGMQTEYNTMMTKGIDFSGETQLVRFVNNTVEQVRETVSTWVEGMQPAQEGGTAAFAQLEPQSTAQPGAGGFWPIKKKQVPEGASLELYTIPETLTLPVAAGITSEFGFRKNPVTGEDDFHMGLDLGAGAGTGVAAALSGQVTQAGYSKLRGNYIVLHHRAGLQTLYQHLSCGFVRTGENVTEGQIIGTVGSTGVSTGPHLHLELVVDGKRVDPAAQFPKLEKVQP